MFIGLTHKPDWMHNAGPIIWSGAKQHWLCIYSAYTSTPRAIVCVYVCLYTVLRCRILLLSYAESNAVSGSRSIIVKLMPKIYDQMAIEEKLNSSGTVPIKSNVLFLIRSFN